MLVDTLKFRLNINGDVVVAYINESQVGYIKLGWKDNKAFVAFIYVEPVYRRKGVAVALYQEAAKSLALCGHKLYADTFQHEKAQAVWEWMRTNLKNHVGTENGRMFLSFL